jgi:hypothetical protein
MKEIWQRITGDSFIVDVRALHGRWDGYEGASRYLTKYLTKASSSGSLANELEVDLRGFHLVGSWDSPCCGSWAPLPHLSACGSRFGAPFGVRGKRRCTPSS